MKNEKTWIAIVAIVVLIFGVSLFSALKSREFQRSLRFQKEQELVAKNAELAQLQAAFDKLTKNGAVLEKKLQADLAAATEALNDSKKNEHYLTGRVDALGKEKQALVSSNNDNTAVLLQLKKKIERLEQERSELQTQRMAVQTAREAVEILKETVVDDLQAAPAAASKASDLPEPVNLGKIVVQKVTSQAARVDYVNSLYGFVIINAGAKDGLRPDMLINITRDNRFVARAVVKQLRDYQASALLLPEWMREEVRVGNIVRVE